MKSHDVIEITVVSGLKEQSYYSTVVPRAGDHISYGNFRGEIKRVTWRISTISNLPSVTLNLDE